MSVVPADAIAYLKRELKAVPVSRAQAAMRSWDEVYSAALDAGAGSFTAEYTASSWAAEQLCTDTRMQDSWEKIQRVRSSGTFTELGAIHEKSEGLGKIFLQTASGANFIQRKAPWSDSRWSEWLSDLDKAIARVAHVLRQKPSYDSTMLFNNTSPANTRDPLETLSDKLRDYHTKLAGLGANARQARRGNRNDLQARRQRYASRLSSWMEWNLGCQNQTVVVACVSLIFGCEYSVRQLRRDIKRTLPDK